MEKYEGGCLCGEVRFVATGAPDRVGLCHCLDCRKHHGAAFFATAVFAPDQVTIKGATDEFEGRHFCTKCGSSVYSLFHGEVELYLGSLDEPSRLKPTYELWTCRRESWLSPVDGAEQFHKGRDT